MKEFLFYQGPTETRRFLEYLLQREYYLVPKIPFLNGQMPRISGTLPERALEDLFPNLSLLIFGPFSSEGPVVRPLPSGQLARVSDNQGGPMIALHLPGSWLTKDGRLELAPGMLSLQSEFWNVDLSKKMKPTPALNEHFATLVKGLKKQSIRIGSAWLGTEALSLFRNAHALFRPNDLNAIVAGHLADSKTGSE